MNKKIIKYLIWSILLTAILILMPIKQVDAAETVTYDKFSISRNLYCLNYGSPFPGTVKYDVITRITDGTFKIPKNSEEDTDVIVDTDVVKYIVWKAQGLERSKIGNYEPQRAIWMLAGTGNKSIKTESANRLVAEGKAYNTFVNAGSPKPTIEKHNTDSDKFVIKYYQTTDYHNGIEGSYTNLSGITVTGAECISTDKVKNGWCKKTYKRKGNATEAKVTVEYAILTADLQLYKSTRNGRTVQYLTLYDTKMFEITEGLLYHYNCVYEQDRVMKFYAQGIIDGSTCSMFECQGCGKALFKVVYAEKYYTKEYMGSVEEGETYQLLEKTKSETIYITPQNLLYGTAYKETKSIPETIPFIQPVTLTFNKEDFSGKSVSGAKIKIEKVTDGNVDTIDDGDSKTIDLNGSVEIMPAKDNKGNFKIKLTETAPTGYKEIPDTTLTVTYDNGAVTKIESSNTTYVPDSNSKNVTIKNRPAVEISFNKKDFSGNLLTEAKISIVGSTGVSKIEGRDSNNELTSNSSGKFGTITVYPTHASYDAGTTGEFKLTIKETQAPTDCNKFNGGDSVTLTVKYDTTTGKVTSISANKVTKNFSFDDDTVTLTIKDDSRIINPDIDYTIIKKDTLGKKLKDIKFKLEFTDIEYVNINGKKYTSSTIENLITNSEGKIIINKIVAADNVTKVTMTITETDSTDEYYGVTSTLTLTWNYSTESRKWELENPSTPDRWTVNKDAATITVENQPILNNLTIVKKDKLTNKPIKDVIFEISLENVEFMEDYEIATREDEDNYPTLIYAKTDSDGKIKLDGLVLVKGATYIKATIREIDVPYTYENKHPDGYYYKVDSTPIIVTITYSNGSWSVSGGETTGTSISADKATISGRDAQVTIKNQPYIALDGMVWEDAQQGDKLVTEPDGNINKYYKYEKVDENNGNYKYNEVTAKFEDVGENKGNYIKEEISETGLKDVQVRLYSETAEKSIESTYTAGDGTYSFIDIPKTEKGYRVIFNYDGINWQETNSLGTNGKDSKVIKEYYRSGTTEAGVGRKEFNNKFKTIEKGYAIATDGTKIPLSYTYDSKEKSTLNVEMDGRNPANGNKKDFQMRAITDTYYATTSSVNCGLVKKVFDLALGTDVKEAKLIINDKTTTYSYAQIMNGEMEDLTLDGILQNDFSSKESVDYNFYIYSSDYSYRIKDYKTDVKGNNVPDNDRNNKADYLGLNELEAYVTYNVILKNQTTKNATVNEFVYYYDEAYTPYNINSTDTYDVSIDTNARKITFTSKGDGFKLTSPAYSVELFLTFKINKDNEDNLVVNETATNIAEITKYSTDEGGLIDRDSAPNNGISNGKMTQYEDDTAEAKGLNIILKDEEESRKIKGTVFEDLNKDGILNADETRVNDVIVQLIEIRKEDTNKNDRIDEEDIDCEYIWQETRSGNNQVKTTARNGHEGTSYTNSVTKAGEYEFKDFIAGDYIIRYIYGDGKTYDITSDEYKDSADNVKKYNGQDYKSTKDINYNKECYNTAGYTQGQSVARDNEVRRLEVMEYSTTINGENGQELSNKTMESLNNTWMCAETSIINTPVDADNKATKENSTTASYTYTKNEEKVEFEDINFGLALRPETNIVLEKHITGLKITPSGTGVQPIVDAKAESIESIVNGEAVDVKGMTNGLATIKSTASNRGFWQVSTDIEELLQGANLEVEYTYVIRNDSDEDYLSKILVNAYEGYKTEEDGTRSNEKLGMTYKEYLDRLKYDTRGKTHTYGTYLGQVYYRGLNGDGTVPGTDALVSSRVEKFEEALNNDLAFDEAIVTDFEVAREKIKEDVYGVDRTEGRKEKIIDTVVQNTKTTTFLIPKVEENYTTETADWSKTITLRTTLATVAGGELGANIPSYIAEILQYSNAAGRKDMKATPANLNYVHSDDATMVMSNSNEKDEFWAESIIITKPTGEDKLTPIQIVLIIISAIGVLGAGIVLIKKFVLKK